jgi:transcriptional regulator with XRE-family HTH domain
MEELTFGKRIRQLRTQKNIRQQDVVKLLNIDITYLSKIENEKLPPPSEEKIRQLAEIYDVSSDELILLANKIPNDLPQIIQETPNIPQFLRTARDLNSEDWAKLTKYAEDLKKEK